MTIDLTSIASPDDSGANTFARYLYQAKVIFPFFLRCGLDKSEIISIIPEHIEDVCIEVEGNKWRLLQVKSRDAELGGWSLSDLTGKDGALRSIYRTYKTISKTSAVEATLEIHLEQPLSPHGDVTKLLTEEGRSDPAFISKVAKALKIKEEECKNILQRLRIISPLPSRDHIDAVNIRLLTSLNKNLITSEAEEIYDRSLREITRAMEGKSSDTEWPKYVEGNLTITEEQEKLIKAKRLIHEMCSKTLGSIAKKPSALLVRSILPDLSPPTNLEAKLLAGGASEQIVLDAKELRANAVAKEIEHLSISSQSIRSAPSEDMELQDVQNRLIFRTNAAIASHKDEPNPAIGIWQELIDFLHDHGGQLDQNGIFNHDPFLLLGEVCEISDQCVTDWGKTNA